MSEEPNEVGDRPRTYLRRRGRLTRAQARALSELSGRYCLPPDPGAGPLDPAAVFGRQAPLGLEIGFGMGQALIQWARERPDWNLLGIEVYQPGLGAAMLGLEREGLDNVRLIESPVELVLENRIAPDSLAEVRIFFPDPWPKKRHHKRRLLQAGFVRRLTQRLEPGGLLWVATDWEEYGERIVEVLDAAEALERERAPKVGHDPATVSGEDRPATRFESRGLNLGHRVWDLRYVRKRSSTESR